jgi:large subunit ribosomal protein L24
MKIKVGDTVVLLTGDKKDKFVEDKKGVKSRKTGKVLKVLPKEEKVIVEGFNLIKKHQRPQRENEDGKIITTEAPIHVSNVAVVDPKTNTPTRVGYKNVNGTNVRIARKSGELLEKVSTSKKALKAKETTAPKEVKAKDVKAKETAAPKEVKAKETTAPKEVKAKETAAPKEVKAKEPKVKKETK